MSTDEIKDEVDRLLLEPLRSSIKNRTRWVHKSRSSRCLVLYFMAEGNDGREGHVFGHFNSGHFNSGHFNSGHYRSGQTYITQTYSILDFYEEFHEHG